MKIFMKVNITFPVAGSNTSMLSGFLPKWITRLHPAFQFLLKVFFFMPLINIFLFKYPAGGPMQSTQNLTPNSVYANRMC